MRRKYTTSTDVESRYCGGGNNEPGFIKKAKRRRKAIEKSWNTTKDRQSTKKEIQENLA